MFRDVNWDAGSAQDLRYEGEIDFDALWRPRNVQLRRAGDPPAAAMQLTRRGELDQWDVSFALGQGSGNGHVRLHALAPSEAVRRLDAQFELELLAGLLGQSLQVSGPLEQLTVTLPQAGLGKAGQLGQLDQLDQLGRMGKLAGGVPPVMPAY